MHYGDSKKEYQRPNPNEEKILKDEAFVPQFPSSSAWTLMGLLNPFPSLLPFRVLSS
jgi:hypothetical protein